MIAKTRTSRRQVVDRFVFPPLATVAGGILRFYPVKRHLRALAGFLVLTESPQPSDVIVVLGGGSPWRAETGAELFKRGMGPRIYLSSDVDPVRLAGSGAASSYELLLQRGVPAEAILHDRRPGTTADEARSFANYARQLGWRSALVVTDPYHTRRAIHTFRRAVQHRGLSVELRPIGARLDEITLDDWWKSREASASVMSEYATLFVYTALRRI